MFNETANTSYSIYTQMGINDDAYLLQPTDGGFASNFGLPYFVYALALLGVYALCWWIIDNLRSLVQLVTAVLTPFFQPADDKSLVERFGGWAGKSECFVCVFIVVFKQ